MKPGQLVEVRRNGVLIARGTVYGQTSDTQVALRSLTDPSRIGLFALSDVQAP